MSPDISMCEGGDCHRKQSCYRYTAEPSKRQTYFTKPPHKDGECSEYWQVWEHTVGGHFEEGE